MQLYTKILIGMLVGTVLGFCLGPNSRWLPHTAVEAPAQLVRTEPGGGQIVPHAEGLGSARIVDERDAHLHIAWTLTPRVAAALEARGIEARAGAEYTGWVSTSASGVRRISAFGQTLVEYTEWIGRLFVALIKLVVVPLVLFSLIVGVASLGDPRKLGKMGGVTIGYFTLTTVLALLTGLGLTNLIRPGGLLQQQDRAALMTTYSADASQRLSHLSDSPRLVDQIVAIVPTNPFQALARGDMLSVIFVALLVGIAFTLMQRERAEPALRVIESLNDAMVTIVHIAMKLAPFGVAALLFEVVGSTGLSVLLALGAYAGVVLAGLLVHIGVVYATVVRTVVRLPFIGFLRAIRAALVLAFSTSSSSATLPLTKDSCEKNLGVSDQVSSFVLPIGATVNMDGTALYQGVAAVFIAQIYGMDLGVLDQATIVVSATLASVGAAGVPGAGMITLAMVLTTIGVPAEGVALVLGVDRVLDMFRTTTNVIGDATATALVARLQGEKLTVPSRGATRSTAQTGG